GAGVGAASGALIGQGNDKAEPRPVAGHPEIDTDRSIQAAPRQPITLNYKDTPLRAANEDIPHYQAIKHRLDKPPPEEAAVDIDTKLSMKLENVSVKSALNLLLLQAKLTYVVKDEVLVITTPERARGKLVQKVYAVDDLIDPEQEAPGTGKRSKAEATP